jgi:RNA polymerase sigma-70 factor (ECF subfamily)
LSKSVVLNEGSLIEQLKQGDETAFRKIVETWKDMVYNTALGIVQGQEDAEDVAQEVFVQVYESIQSFKGESKLSTWLYRITVTKSLDHVRKKKRKKRFAYIRSLFGEQNEVLLHPPDFLHPGITLDNKERSKVLFDAINRLPDNQRVAFILHKVEGLSYQEISEIMSKSVSSIESLLHRAKLNLKDWLREYYNK